MKFYLYDSDNMEHENDEWYAWFTSEEKLQRGFAEMKIYEDAWAKAMATV